MVAGDGVEWQQLGVEWVAACSFCGHKTFAVENGGRLFFFLSTIFGRHSFCRPSGTLSACWASGLPAFRRDYVALRSVVEPMGALWDERGRDGAHKTRPCKRFFE